MSLPSTKLHGAMASKQSAAKKYLFLTYGPISPVKALWEEFVVFCLQGMPGALGIALRGLLYRPFFAECGKKLVIGRNVMFRHACKIHIGDNVVLDDNSVVDAKGEGNDGVFLGDGVYIGRNTIVYCKGGTIRLGKGVNFSSNCIAFSSNLLEIGDGAMIGAYSYFLSGGEYDPQNPAPFAEQDGMRTRGPLSIGPDCWFGARVTVLDAAQKIGARCSFGAGTVVTKPVPAGSLVVGVPGRARPLPPVSAEAAVPPAPSAP